VRNSRWAARIVGPRKGDDVTDTPERATVGDAPPDEQSVDVAALVAERDALIDQVQRARADYANLKRRSEQELERARGAATERILREILPVLDDLQDGLAHIPADQQDSIANGMRLVEAKFQAALGKLGVDQVESLGVPFDPAQHEAVDFDPAGGQHVASVFRKGYRMGDTLLRPAVVKVGPPPS
jgi:molecular chaperone GrpE